MVCVCVWERVKSLLFLSVERFVCCIPIPYYTYIGRLFWVDGNTCPENVQQPASERELGMGKGAAFLLSLSSSSRGMEMGMVTWELVRLGLGLGLGGHGNWRFIPMFITGSAVQYSTVQYSMDSVLSLILLCCVVLCCDMYIVICEVVVR
jgi:hypothetical protein